MITVKYRGDLYLKIKKRQEEFKAAKVWDLLQQIKAAYGKEIYKEAKRMLITVNNESILLHKGYKTILKDGDVVTFFPIAAGG